LIKGCRVLKHKSHIRDITSIPRTDSRVVKR
jgi:hypothetical protein